MYPLSCMTDLSQVTSVKKRLKEMNQLPRDIMYIRLCKPNVTGQTSSF